MPRYNIVVVSPDRLKADDKHQVIEWPVPIQKGDELDIAPPGCAGGVTANVEKVIHWLGIPETDIYCKIEANIKKTKMQTFETLKATEGWKSY